MDPKLFWPPDPKLFLVPDPKLFWPPDPKLFEDGSETIQGMDPKLF